MFSGSYCWYVVNVSYMSLHKQGRQNIVHTHDIEASRSAGAQSVTVNAIGFGFDPHSKRGKERRRSATQHAMPTGIRSVLH